MKFLQNFFFTLANRVPFLQKLTFLPSKKLFIGNNVHHGRLNLQLWLMKETTLLLDRPSSSVQTVFMQEIHVRKRLRDIRYYFTICCKVSNISAKKWRDTYKGRCLSVKGDRRSSKRNRRLHLANAALPVTLTALEESRIEYRMRGEL